MSKLFGSASGSAPPARLWRILVGLWCAVLVVAFAAPWPYALMAALFVTFVTFAALDERDELDRDV